MANNGLANDLGNPRQNKNYLQGSMRVDEQQNAQQFVNPGYKDQLKSKKG